MSNSEEKQDSNSPVFRSKQEAVKEKVSEDSILREEPKNQELPKSEKGDWSDNPLLFKEEHKKPFLVKEMEIENIYEELSDEVKDDAKLVDWYFKEMVDKKLYANNKKSYHDFIRDLENKTESANNPLDVKLGKFRAFIKYLTEVEHL